MLDAVIDYSRNHTTAELYDLSNGGYRVRDMLEGDDMIDDDVLVEVTTTADGDTIVFDLDGTTD